MKIYFKGSVYRRVIFILCLILSFNQFAISQFYETGQDPFSVSWKQINLKNYQLIFPAGFEPAARKFVSTLDTFNPVSSKYLLKDHKRISIVFHTQSSLSNGMVVYAPKRMELYTIPPQDNYPQDWLNQLALHETRHVVQLDALNQGLTRFGSFLIGQQAVGAVSGLVPRWFLEGDAVYSETIFSSAGRGRSAAFQMPYRALVLSRKKLFSYEKAMLGSYRNFVPDIYQMGYPMVKMMRDSFDCDIFGKSLKYTARNPYLVFPFGHSLKTISGLNNRFTYEFTYKTLRKVWEQQNQYSSYQHLPVKETRTFTNYHTPVQIYDSLVLAQKWSLANTRRYILIDKQGKEKKLITVGSNNSDRISVHQNKLAWSENKTDLRWTNRTYSEVMVYDMEHKTRKVLTKKTWYFSPAFSEDGRRIAVIEESPEYQSALVILDALSGKVLHRIPAPDGNHLQYPVWNQNEVYCLSVQKNGKSIIKTVGDSWTEIMAPTFNNISSFLVFDNYLIFAGENNGLNNIFIFNPSDNNYSQVTNSRFGAFEPYLDTNNRILYFSEYTSDGYRISFTPWYPNSYPKIRQYSDDLSNTVSLENTGFNIQNIAKDSSFNSKYEMKKYSRLPHLLNVHSWLPAYFNYSVSDFSNPGLYPGLMLLSQDVLGTLVSSAGYSYRNGYSHFHANISYKALLPIISWNIDLGGPIQHVGSTTALPLTYNKNIQSTVSISLPLNLSRGKYASGITPWVEWKLNRNAYYIKSENNYYQGLHYINFGVNFYRYTKMAIRDIFPKFGVSSFFKAQTTPFENKLFSEIYAVNTRLYLPGLMNNHSFQVRYAYQRQSSLRYLYGSMISFPAGYVSQRSEELHAMNVTYALPLVYPDFHLGPVLYLKRIRTHLFYDIASNKYHSSGNIITHNILRSVGTDLIADIHFLRIMFPFQVGARIAYLPREKSIFSQAIFSVNLVY